MAESYQPTSPSWLDEALASTRFLMETAAKTLHNPLRDRGDIPKPDTDMRITPKV